MHKTVIKGRKIMSWKLVCKQAKKVDNKDQIKEEDDYNILHGPDNDN